MSDPDAPDGTSSEAEESQVGSDKPIESVNPMAEVFQSKVNPMAEVFQSIGDQPPPKDLSPEEKAKGRKGCLISIGIWIAVITISRVVMSAVGEDEVQTQQATERYGNSCTDLVGALGGELDVGSAMDLRMRRSCARTRGIDLNRSLGGVRGFEVLTYDEYGCVGELSVSKSITTDDMSDWFLGYDLGPQVNDSMWELFYECGDVRRYVAATIINWWGDDLGVGLRDESFVECLIEELSEDLALDWLKLPKEDPPSPAQDDLWNEMGLSYQAGICAP